MIKKLFLVVIALQGILIVACRKESYITSSDALLRLGTDTLHFDTVFVTTGSTSRFLKIFNLNDKKLRISNIQLMGGASSPFKLNVDGIAGFNFNNVELEANDSTYLYATVTINPNLANLPFVVRDSVKFTFNGNTRWLQLEAFGRNARFLRDSRITIDSSFTNDKPIVILGSLVINENRTLTIQKGTKIYTNAQAPILVNGTLNAIGERWDSTKIEFLPDRLDEPYANYPGSWPGIYFNTTSRNSVLQFCTIKNAYQAIVSLGPSVNGNPKVALRECIIDNAFDVGIGANNSSVTAQNCLVSNCGNNLAIVGGGNYNFLHCSFVTISNLYINHKTPVFNASNVVNSSTNNPLTIAVQNSIIYGSGGLVDNEIKLTKQGTTPFNVSFINTLYKYKDADPTSAIFTNCLKNAVPIFDSIDAGNRVFNFRPKAVSPVINKGIATTLLFDLDGKNRTVGVLPDLGCYEFQ